MARKIRLELTVDDSVDDVSAAHMLNTILHVATPYLRSEPTAFALGTTRYERTLCELADEFLLAQAKLPWVEA